MQGIELCQHFYQQAIQPILDQHFPNLPYTAALVGSGSEILGFDDAMSTDHHWGPRGMIFLHEEDHMQLAKRIHDVLAHNLPYEFLGYPTHFSEPDANDNGVQHLEVIQQGPVNHRVELLTIRGFVQQQLGFDLKQPLEVADWLTFPTQKLRTLTTGAIYHDGIDFQSIRDRFAWYPQDLWLYLLAAGWARIGQEEHLMGRAGLVGDEIGSALLGSRLVRDVMRLCFLMERSYAPYPKWFGTAFKRLRCGNDLYPTLQEALAARTWQEREAHLIPAYEAIARMHNQLGLTETMPETARQFFGRPFQVIALHGFESALMGKIQDPIVKQIAERRPIGSVDLFSDSTDLLEGTNWRTSLRQLYL